MFETKVDGMIDPKTGDAYCWSCAGDPSSWPEDAIVKYIYRSLPIYALACSTCDNAVGIVEVHCLKV